MPKITPTQPPVPLHGHRPGRGNVSGVTHAAAGPPDQTQSTAEAHQTGPQGEAGQSLHLGSVNLKVHRQSAQQSALLAQVPLPLAGTRAAAPQPAPHDPDGLADLSALLPLAPTGQPQTRSGQDDALAALMAQLPVPPSTRPHSRQNDAALAVLKAQLPIPPSTRPQPPPNDDALATLTAQLPLPPSTRPQTALPHLRSAPGAVRPAEPPSRQADPHQLNRFVQAQAQTYHAAISELQRGAKKTHWMWFVFPQLGALGQSNMAKQYGLENLTQARAYWEHPVLGPRLREGIRTMLQVRGASAESLLGQGDALKFQSCLTLFAEVDPSNRDIQLALARFYKNKPDELTQALIRS